MLKSYSRLKRWEQTDDVLQNALVRLYRALSQVTPATAADFFRLAALNVRRELLDLSKHYYGPQGQAAHHASLGGDRGSEDQAAAFEQPDAGDNANRLSVWTEFHRQVDQLPEEERET